MNQHLIIFTIGPVQSFIAQARKTQDLYAGSYLLSHLCRYVIKNKDIGLEIEPIFPSKDAIDSYSEYATLPNQFLATIKSDSGDIKKKINKLKNLVENEFYNIGQIASGDILKANFIASKIFENQIKDYFNIFWVSLPLQKENYAQNFSDIGKYLGSIKNTRNFNQLQEDGRKCSVCGERNIIFYRKNEFEKSKRHDIIKKNKLFNKDVIIIEFEMYDTVSLKNLQPGEGLCAVCYTKRCLNKYFASDHKFIDGFPSTAEIALLEAISKLENKKIEKFTKIFKNFDHQLFYEENLTVKYFNKYGYPETELERAKKDIEAIYEDAKNKKIHLSKYYSIVVLDGDDIGKWLSGIYLHDNSELCDFHVLIAKELFQYAEKVPNIIEKSKGRLVYSGGDDTLAFVNLNHLLCILKELRENYPKFETSRGIKIINNHKSSVSCGICIAHYKAPLSEAINWARKMAKEAKEIDTEKDAMAVALMMRSGEIRKTCFKWQHLPLLDELTKKLTTHFSDKFILNLREELFPLYENEEIEYDDISLSHEMIESELKRLILRAKRSDIDKEKFQKDIKEFASKKIKPFLTSQFLDDANKYSFSVVNFISFFEVARFLYKECLEKESDLI